MRWSRVIQDRSCLIFSLLSPLFGQANLVGGMRAEQHRETNVLPRPSIDLGQSRCLVVKLHCVFVWCMLRTRVEARDLHMTREDRRDLGCVTSLDPVQP
jgi:hypothetical protein